MEALDDAGNEIEGGQQIDIDIYDQFKLVMEIQMILAICILLTHIIECILILLMPLSG